MNRIANYLSDLATYRKDVSHSQNVISQLEERLKQTEEYQKLESEKNYLKNLQLNTQEIEDKVREISLGAYIENGDKHPHPAVEIKIFSKLSYDENTALSWASEHHPKALKLDKKEFEKAAKVLELSFVEISDDPRSYIQSNLAEYLLEENENDKR